ncbi:MAG: hypothetical protein ACM3ZA_01080, partial [Bacillota bacterium]
PMTLRLEIDPLPEWVERGRVSAAELREHLARQGVGQARKPARPRRPGADWRLSWARTAEGTWINLTVPELHPSLNEWTHWHWSRRHELLERWTQAVTVLAKHRKCPQLARATCKVVYYFPRPARRDTDNYAPKLLLDALRKGGILTDDNAAVLDLAQVELLMDARRPRMEVELRGEELERP